MMKVDIVEELMERHDMERKQAVKTVNAFIEAIRQGVIQDGRVFIINFDVFEKRRQGRRVIHNPITRKYWTTEANWRPWFRPATQLNADVNK